MNPGGSKPLRFADLGIRLASGLALAAIAVFDLWMGGAWVAALAAVAVALMLWEYHRMVTGDRRRLAPVFLVLAGGGAGSVMLTAHSGLAAGMGLLGLAGLVVAVISPTRRWWLFLGLIYIGLAMCYLVVIRDNELQGLPVVLWLILVVVASDVGAYLAGRAVGGPKLWPAVSPGKTWSGALGGLAFATLIGAGFGLATERHLPEFVLLSIGISIAAQIGDLIESAVKRRYSVKDASRLIPGHGGVMDRLDGLVGGLWFFLICDILIGVARL